ncbi:MAG: hypothetical protein GWN01_13785, partial [Nitrosopumilaceae archaeon]|nr:hypothetical protein [Nitrosopumilaceae archaeon]NIU88336.1 hypothetical protein [Nitrosopumilaceae archaeon]NIX62536.1 hypothetical protein [Nitrosopumilaceae archaeon]
GGSQNIVAILTIEKDSTDANGNIYIKYKQEPDYSIRIDSSLNVFYIKNGAPFTRNSGLYYKLSTEIGDRWVVDDSSTTYLRMWGKVVDIFAGYWLHRPTTIMQIDYWWETQPGDSFWVETRYLPKDLVSLREYLNQVLLIMQQAQLLMA